MTVEEYRALIHGQNQKSPSRQIQNSKNKADGALFEAMVKESCELYKAKKLAYIEKTPEPVRYVRPIKAHTFEAYFEAQAQPDFKGTLKGGRSICFDAKHTNRDRIEKSVVTEVQTKALRFHQTLGALCFILLGVEMQKFYVIPWEDWENMERIFKYKHIKRKDLDQYQVHFDNRIICFLKGS